MAGWFSIPESPGFHPGLLGAQKAPVGRRGTPGRMPSRVPCATGSNRQRMRGRAAWMAGRFSYPESPGFHPGLLGAQKAPGGSRGTPGCMPSRVPCATGSNRRSVRGPAAWMAGWFSYPESPGFHPGLLGAQKAPGGSRGTPGRMPSRLPSVRGRTGCRFRRARPGRPWAARPAASRRSPQGRGGSPRA